MFGLAEPGDGGAQLVDLATADCQVLDLQPHGSHVLVGGGRVDALHDRRQRRLHLAEQTGRRRPFAVVALQSNADDGGLLRRCGGRGLARLGVIRFHRLLLFGLAFLVGLSLFIGLGLLVWLRLGVGFELSVGRRFRVGLGFFFGLGLLQRFGSFFGPFLPRLAARRFGYRSLFAIAVSRPWLRPLCRRPLCRQARPGAAWAIQEKTHAIVTAQLTKTARRIIEIL